MQKTDEAPKLVVIGQASDVVAGSGLGGPDVPQQSAPDFEFEQD